MADDWSARICSPRLLFLDVEFTGKRALLPKKEQGYRNPVIIIIFL